MLTRALSGAVFAALALFMTGAPVAAVAQTTEERPSTVNPESTATSRSGRRQDAPRDQQAPRRGRTPAAPNPEQVKTAAEAVVAATGSTCQVTQAVLRGQIETSPVYETACATGPGLILIATPPTATDCVVLFGQAETTRARDPEADVGLQCEIESNKDILKVIREYAVAAGVACTVDQGKTLGKSSADNVIYEIGCAGVDGYWIEKTATGWTKTECQKVVTTNGRCGFTTPEEQAATLKTWLAGSAASACDVSVARYMGANANGSFYEAKCAAGDGYVARFGAAMAVQQVYPCAEAARIGGGCTLTTVPAAAPAAAPATQR